MRRLAIAALALLLATCGVESIRVEVPTCGCETHTVEVWQEIGGAWIQSYSGPTENAFWIFSGVNTRTRCIDPNGLLPPGEWVYGISGQVYSCVIPHAA